MDIPLIEFAEWLPDLPPYNSPGATTATNCIAGAIGYEPFESAASYAAAPSGMVGRISGAAGYIDPTGVGKSFAGDDGKLYRLDSVTWTDVSKSGGYSVPTGERWRFGLFGNLVIATNYDEPVQVWNLGASPTPSAFADLAATAPKARYVATVKDHLFFGYTNDSADGEVQNRVWFSPIGDPSDNDWGNTDKQSDFQDIPLGNRVQGVVGGEYGLVIMDTAIFRADYTGDALIYSFSAISTDKGCVAPDSIAKVGGVTFFLAEDGFYACDGASVQPIGNNKVDEFFRDDVDPGKYDTIRAAIDPRRKLYLCAYPTPGSDLPDRILVYRYDIGRWSLIEEDCDLLVRLVSAGYTLEQLDSISSSIDALPASLDSRDYAGGGPLFGKFDNGVFSTFTGTPKTATIETAEFSPNAQARTRLRRVRPIVDGTVTVQDGTRTNPTDAVTWSAAQSLTARGEAAFRQDARFHRIRCNISGTWSYAHGIEAKATTGGRR